MKIETNRDDLYVFLTCTLRYALGRSSYIVSDVINLLTKYECCLEPWQFEGMIREIRNELSRCERNKMFCGMEMDHNAWRKFVEKYS